MPRPTRKYHKRYEPVHNLMERQHPLYPTWAGMMTRCYWEKCPEYINYGARGIEVDPSWWHFKNFANDMGLKPFKNATLDRIDNNQGYSKSNCKWATRSEQNLNRRPFKNSGTGVAGVFKKGNYYEAKIDWQHKRYRLGSYETIEQAEAARKEAEAIIKNGGLPEVIKDTLWRTSSTKHRGVTPHKNGGFIVRVTIEGKRTYLGYYKTLDEAVNAKLARNKS